MPKLSAPDFIKPERLIETRSGSPYRIWKRCRTFFRGQLDVRVTTTC